MKKIAVLVGSASKSSFNQKIAAYLQQIVPESVQLEIVPIADLLLYDRDLDALDPQPESYTRLRQSIAQADGVLFITPEHNGGIPALLKNAIDVASRPQGQSVWQGKPAAIITAAAAMAGGARCSDQLRSVAAVLGLHTFPSNVNIAQVYALFNEQGELVSEPVVKLLNGFIGKFAEFVQ